VAMSFFDEFKLSDFIVVDLNLNKYKDKEERGLKKASTGDTNSQKQPLNLNQEEEISS